MGLTLEGRLKAQAASKALSEKNSQELREAMAMFGHLPNSTSLIAKHLHIKEPAVRNRAKVAGVSLIESRVTPDGTPRTEAPKKKTHWKKNIVELFDALFEFFEVRDDETADDPDEAPVVDTDNPLRTWIAWRVFLAAAFGLPCPDDDPDCPYPGVPVDEAITRGAAALPPNARNLEIFEACTGRSVWPTVQARLVTLVVGRRGGKSYITAIIGIYLACCKHYTLKRGTRGMVMILARDREQAGVIRGYVLSFLQAVPQLKEMLVGEPTQKLIELNNGITIEIRAVSEAGTRGYTVVGALMDEIAFWPTDAESAKQDVKVLRAIRPAMFGIKGAMIVMLSSPYAKRGAFYDAYRKSYGDNESVRQFVWQADTLSMRPESDEELLNEIRAEYEDDPESAHAEYGAHFRTDLESIFSKGSLEALSADGVFERPYVLGTHYRGFVDPSGGSSDSYTLAIAHDEMRTVNGMQVKVAVLDKLVEWKPRFDPEQVSIEVVAVCKAYRLTSVTGDAYAGEWPRDPLKKRGIGYKLSEMSRSELYLTLLPKVNSGHVVLLDKTQHARTVNQLANLERKPGRGKDVVDHPPNSHDDCANAAAGVLVSGTNTVRLGAVWGKGIRSARTSSTSSSALRATE